MNKNQPKIVPPKTTLQVTLNALGLVGLVGFVIFFLLEWPGLPDPIPQHYDAQGKPDAYGSKYTLMLLPLLAIAIYFSFNYLNKRPYTFNYPVKITEENAAYQYTLAMNMMSALATVVILVFFYISWKTVTIVKEKASGLGWWFLPVFLLIAFLPVVIYLIKANQKTK